MIVQVLNDNHLELGKVQFHVAGEKIYRADIFCKYEDKLDMTALSLCCRKLDREQVQDITFKDLEDSDKTRKIIDRELRGKKYLIEPSEPIVVTLTPQELEQFRAFQKTLFEKSVQKFEPRGPELPPKNFSSPIQPGDKVKYDGSLCTSPFETLTVKSVSKKGVEFMEPTKLPVYSHEHFEPFGAFTKI